MNCKNPTAPSTPLGTFRRRNFHPVLRRIQRSALAAFTFALGAIASPSAQAQGSPLDGIDLGNLDLGNLIQIFEDPLALSALETLTVEFPLDLTGEDPVLVLIIDPDGNPNTDDSFALPIQLSELLNQDEDSLLAILNLTEDIIDEDDIDLIPGLEDVLEGVLDGLFDLLFGIGDAISLGDIVDELNDGVITAVGIDVGTTTSDVAYNVLEIVGLDRYRVIREVEEVPVPAPTPPAGPVSQPDVTVGKRPNAQVGNDVYSGGSGQTIRQPKTHRARNKAFFTIGNDGSASDVIISRARVVGPNAKALKIQARGANITSAIRTGRYRTTLAPGAKIVVRVQDSTPRKAVNPRSLGSQIVAITSRSQSDPTKIDRAEVVIGVGKTR